MPAAGALMAEVLAAIEALRGQLYPHWELCLVTPEAMPALAETAARDLRIRLLPPGPVGGLGSGGFLAALDVADRLACSLDTLGRALPS